MQPKIYLDEDTLRANARAWRAACRVPVRAVIKARGYGWGYAPLVRALEGEVEAFCVSDERELAALRKHTNARAIVLGSVSLAALPGVLAMNALPTIATHDELAIVERFAASTKTIPRVRIGVRPAAAWSGSSPEALRQLVPELVRASAEVELWGHVTDFDRRDDAIASFQEAAASLSRAGVNVVATDLASTYVAAASGAHGTSVRIGVGLFGATGGVTLPHVRCALRVLAPVVRIERLDEAMFAGYGNASIPAGTSIATGRCGYADGLAQRLAGSDGILSIGMQYVTVLASRVAESGDHIALLDESSDLDALAVRAGVLPHAVVTSFGNAACARAGSHDDLLIT